MRIVVFGASSRAGLYIVKEALERGHRVAAFTSRPGIFPLGHPKLDIIGGDILDPAAVARAVSGAHGVICALGARWGKAAAAGHSKGPENIIWGMEAAGCRRVVWLASAGCLGRGPSAREDAFGRILASGLDWVLVDTPRFRDGSGPVRVQVGSAGRAGKYVYLADLAAFLVEELESGRYLKKIIAVLSHE